MQGRAVDLGDQALTCIVFSKDRAIQLHAFLRSYRKHVTLDTLVFVLFKATTERHAYAYAEVRAEIPFANFVEEEHFKQDLLSLLPDDGFVTFFVDDQIFVRPWDVNKAQHGLSLRLAPHLTKCYPTNSGQRHPLLFQGTEVGKLSWWWMSGEGDWGYPLSLDGHVFDAVFIRELVKQVDFNSPNTLESALQRFVPMFRHMQGECYSESRVVNVPRNRVQTDYDNRHGGGSPDDLLEMWENGKQICISELNELLNESCHQEFPLVLETRS